MDIKLEIQKMAKEIGISKIGFTTADDFAYLQKNTAPTCISASLLLI